MNEKRFFIKFLTIGEFYTARVPLNGQATKTILKLWTGSEPSSIAGVSSLQEFYSLDQQTKDINMYALN